MGFAALPLTVGSHSPQATRVLPAIRRVRRQGAVLGAGPDPGLPHLKSIDLTDDCVMGCAFCYARASLNVPRDGPVHLFTDSAEALENELRSRSRRPKAVYLSPGTDPFPPLVEVQIQAARVVEVLVAHGVDAWLMTRGYIRPTPLRSLAACRDRVRVTIPLTTMDRSLQRMLEPWSAPPRLRLRQIDHLRRLGIKVQVSLEPLVPGLTDSRTNLTGVLEALARIGVRHIQAGYMFLRPGMQESLLRALEPYGCAGTVLEAFQGGPVLQTGTSRFARHLPKRLRQRGYAAIMALAADLGMTISVNGATNPDFRPSSPLERAGTSWQQPLLPAFVRSA
jgi:DNA repair photolyase